MCWPWVHGLEHIGLAFMAKIRSSGMGVSQGTGRHRDKLGHISRVPHRLYGKDTRNSKGTTPESPRMDTWFTDSHIRDDTISRNLRAGEQHMGHFIQGHKNKQL